MASVGLLVSISSLHGLTQTRVPRERFFPLFFKNHYTNTASNYENLSPFRAFGMGLFLGACGGNKKSKCLLDLPAVGSI